MPHTTLQPVLHSILNIPELWQDIFLECLPDKQQQIDDAHTPGPNHLRSEAPILLCHVSRSWRRLAHATPRLWSNLSVNIISGRSTPPLPYAMKWLQRSCATPLTLSLFQSRESHDDDTLARSFIWQFELHIPRCRQMALRLPNKDSLRQFLFGSFISAPQLRSFKLLLNECSETDMPMVDETITLRVLRAAPQLSRFSMNGLTITRLSAPAEIGLSSPFRKLTGVHLDRVADVGLGLDVLHRCPNLLTCHFGFRWQGHDNVDAPIVDLSSFPVVTSHHLQTLHLSIFATELPSFLDHIRIPAVTDLTIHVKDYMDDEPDQLVWPHYNFMNMLSESKCQLTRLELHDAGMVEEEFNEFISHAGLQKLVDLAIVENWRSWQHETYVKDRALTMMMAPGFPATDDRSTGDDKTVCVVPALESLVLRGWCLMCADGTFTDFIESRWRASNVAESEGSTRNRVARLKRLEVKFSQQGYDEDRVRLKVLEEEGLELLLHDSSDVC